MAKVLQSGLTTQLAGLSAAGAGGYLALAAGPAMRADVCCRYETLSANVEGAGHAAPRSHEQIALSYPSFDWLRQQVTGSLVVG